MIRTLSQSTARASNLSKPQRYLGSDFGIQSYLEDEYFTNYRFRLSVKFSLRLSSNRDLSGIICRYSGKADKLHSAVLRLNLFHRIFEILQGEEQSFV